MSNITCGHCRQTHSSVAEVKACFAQGYAVAAGHSTPAQHTAFIAAQQAQAASVTEAPVTEAQRSFLAVLANRVTSTPAQANDAAQAAQVGAGAASISKRDASALIGRLKALQAPAPAQVTAKADSPAESTVAVPEGRYAVEVDGVLKFFKVDCPTEGRWAGYTFIKVQASDEWYPVGRASRQAILAKIAEDPKAASIRYGHELGACGVCGRTLTDEASRAAGIGPVCAEKAVW